MVIHVDRTPTVNPAAQDAVQSYRDVAERCRKMAAVSRRPGPLVLRAQVYEEAALDLERVMARQR